MPRGDRLIDAIRAIRALTDTNRWLDTSEIGRLVGKPCVERSTNKRHSANYKAIKRLMEAMIEAGLPIELDRPNPDQEKGAHSKLYYRLRRGWVRRMFEEKP